MNLTEAYQAENFLTTPCMLLFSHSSILIYNVGAQKNRLFETVLLSTNNKCLGWEIRENKLLRTFD